MKRLLLFFSIIMICLSGRAQLVAVKTNGLMDLAMVPNASLEVATSGRTSVAFEFAGSRWCYGKYVRTLSAAPEFRFWFGGRTFDRFFIGAGFQGLHYSIQHKKEMRRGDSFGPGISFGYDWYINSHLAIDFHSGIGAFYYKQRHSALDELVNDNPVYHSPQNEYNERGCRILPFKLGVSVVYIIK